MMKSGIKKFVLYSNATLLLPIQDNSPFLPVFFCFFIEMNVIQRRKQVSQVSKTSSSSGTYLCFMKGGACGIWTLGEYRVSCFKGYNKALLG
jgi:hypothetical protein